MLPRAETHTPVHRHRGAVSVVTALLMIAAVLASCSSSGDTPAASESEQDNSVLDEVPESATSSQRIRAALDAGEIDEPTATLYGLWAQFGSRELPEQFRGAPEHHDAAEIAEVYESLDTLPDEVREQVEPFFKRPSDPESAFSANEENKAPSVRNVAQVEDSYGNIRCSQDWISQAVPGQPFRVWACPDLGVDEAEAMIASVSDVVAASAGPIMADAPEGMGPPIPDDANAVAAQPSDDKIDIYVLPHGWLAPYRGLNERRMDQMATAITMPAAPRTAENSSAYMLVAQELLDYPDGMERVLVHELFHVLQYAHFGGLDNSTAWLFESSAVWAETVFAQDLTDFRYKADLTFMQDSELSLLSEEFRHRYAASLWFVFMEQEAGPESVMGVWHALDSADAGSASDAVVSALESQIDLESAFPEFAMRLLNPDLPGNPVTLFNDFNSTIPRDGPPDLAAHTMEGDTLTLDDLTIPGLGYRYKRITVEGPSPDGTSVRVTPDLSTPSGTSPSIEALVESPGGDYDRVSIDPTGTDLCVAGDLWLVIANTSVTITDQTSGTVELTRSESADCATPSPTTTAPPVTQAPTTTVAPPTTQGDAPDAVAAPTGDFCTDMLAFQRNIGALADGTGLPVTSQRVAAIFALAEPHLAGLPDGGIGQVEILRSYADQAAGQSASAASAVLANEEFQRNADSISFLVRFC